jgi:hypothetical protein
LQAAPRFLSKNKITGTHKKKAVIGRKKIIIKKDIQPSQKKDHRASIQLLPILNKEDYRF